MIAGLSGTLLSHEALEQALRGEHRLFEEAVLSQPDRARIRRWHLPVRSELGPVSAARTIFDRLAVPLFAQLGYRVVPAGGSSDLLRAMLEARNRSVAALVVTGWGRGASTAWREAARHGIAAGVPWCFCATGPALRIVDSRRTYSRRYLEFDLETTLDDERAFHVFWSLVRADAAGRKPDGTLFLHRVIEVSEHHRSLIKEALQAGVEDALLNLLLAFTRAAGRLRRPAPDRSTVLSRMYNESLTVIYRILFLLFAEARGLVPRWHPVFRESYTIEALREPVELLPRPRGLWETLQAIARLAHSGCHVGALKVPPFNGRLFSPGESPLSDVLRLDDAVVRQAVLALTTRRVRSGRVRVSYSDLGVEQLGGIYERLLDVEPEPTPGRRRPSLVRAETRKATGSFYTPRSLTEFVVRRTLAPLVQDASSEQILALRVLDPAMGSGAFLVAACRYLASAYEAALAREGVFATADVTDAERVEFRRAIAQRCLFGVDINPMAVQLGRLSLWLATMAADRPLTFLDHRLRTGNSLVGAGLADVLRQPTASGRPTKSSPLPLFADEGILGAIGEAVVVRSRLALEPDDTLTRVRAKEQALVGLERQNSMRVRWKAVADLWCAGWFRSLSGQRQAAAAFGALSDRLLGRETALTARVAEPLLEETRAVAAEQRFFHWTLEFPEIFYHDDGRALDAPGFDAILGNPPWEMLRGDRGSAAARSGRHADASRLTAFARTSGVYRFQGGGHANLYQLFLDRTLSLLRTGGRFGLVLPFGLAVDQGSTELRRALFDRTAMDGILSIENRDGLFPIHRGLKFLLVTGTSGRPTESVACRFGIRSPDSLDAIPDDEPGDAAVRLPRSLIERVSGPSLAVPELRTPRDVELFGELSFRWPPLGAPAIEGGWNARFGRELNATDDRSHFLGSSESGRGVLPVIEGKHLSPFGVDVAGSSSRIRAAAAAQLLNGPETFQRHRLGYRDVACPTNRLSLIAAVLPAGVVTTHTVQCLKTPLDEESLHFLCGVLNSFVANYLIRARISTHVGASMIARLPVPKPERNSMEFREISRAAASMARSRLSAAASKLQGMTARLYGISEDQFRHVLDTFPLIPIEERHAAMQAFCDIVC